METEFIKLEKKNGGAWEGCVNSVIYRIERGVRVEVPREVAEIIRRSEKERLQGEMLGNRFRPAKICR